MRTQSNVDSDARQTVSDRGPDAGPETMSFRADSIDAAVALAEESLGASVRVVSASRIRRGGIGGFFASDLGVEVSVALEDETIEQALERLVSETAVDERTRWLEHRAGDAPTTAPAPARNAAAADAAPAPIDAAPRPNPLATPRASESVVRLAQRDEEPSMVRVEQIIEELQFLTRRSDNELASPPDAPARTVVLPTLPPRPTDITRAASANAAASQATAVADELALARRALDLLSPNVVEPTLPQPARSSSTTVLASPSLLASSRPWTAERSTGTTRNSNNTDNGQATALAFDVVADISSDDTGAAPSQRQVELAVAATDQLIESLQRETGAKRLSVRVVLRTGEKNAVEAEAEWEA